MLHAFSLSFTVWDVKCVHVHCCYTAGISVWICYLSLPELLLRWPVVRSAPRVTVLLVVKGLRSRDSPLLSLWSSLPLLWWNWARHTSLDHSKAIKWPLSAEASVVLWCQLCSSFCRLISLFFLQTHGQVSMYTCTALFSYTEAFSFAFFLRSHWCSLFFFSSGWCIYITIFWPRLLLCMQTNQNIMSQAHSGLFSTCSVRSEKC